MAQADGAGLKLTPSEIEAAGLTLEEAEALDGYISDTEPSIGEDAGPQLVCAWDGRAALHCTSASLTGLPPVSCRTS